MLCKREPSAAPVVALSRVPEQALRELPQHLECGAAAVCVGRPARSLQLTYEICLCPAVHASRLKSCTLPCSVPCSWPACRFWSGNDFCMQLQRW